MERLPTYYVSQALNLEVLHRNVKNGSYSYFAKTAARTKSGESRLHPAIFQAARRWNRSLGRQTRTPAIRICKEPRTTLSSDSISCVLSIRVTHTPRTTTPCTGSDIPWVHQLSQMLFIGTCSVEDISADYRSIKATTCASNIVPHQRQIVSICPRFIFFECGAENVSWMSISVTTLPLALEH